MATPEISTTSFNAYYVAHAMTENDMGEPSVIVEQWIVERKADVGGANLQATVRFVEDDNRLAVMEAAMPYVGVRYVDWYGAGTKLWMQYATLVKKEYEHIDNGRIRATYTWLAPFHVRHYWWETGPSSTTTPEIAYDLSVDYSSSFRTTEIFRQTHTSSPLTVPDPTWANGVSPADIGGYAILAGRQGMPYSLPQRRIRVRRTVDFRYMPQSQLQTVFNSYVNTYNSHAFLAGTVLMGNPAGGPNLSVVLQGYPVGTVLFESLNIVKTQGSYGEFVAELVHEPYWHFFDQVPQSDPDGEPQMDVPSAGPWANTRQFKDVRWIRQPRTTKNHMDILFDQGSYTGSGWVPTASIGYTQLALGGWWTK